MQILGGERAFFGIGLAGFRCIDGTDGLLLDLVEADGGFQHEEDFETLAANIGDDAGNLLGLGDAFVDRLTQLMNQFAEFLIQCGTSIPRGVSRPIPYLIF